MLALDIQEFKTAHEFRAYLEKRDRTLAETEAAFIGWLFVFIAEIAMVWVHVIRWAFRTIQKKLLRTQSA